MRGLPLVSANRPVNLVPRRSRTARGPMAIRLWLPLTPLLALLAPFALIASPLLRLHRRTRDLPALRAAWTLGGVLMGLSGTVVDIDTPDARIRIHII